MKKAMESYEKEKKLVLYCSIIILFSTYPFFKFTYDNNYYNFRFILAPAPVVI